MICYGDLPVHLHSTLPSTELMCFATNVMGCTSDCCRPCANDGRHTASGSTGSLSAYLAAAQVVLFGRGESRLTRADK